MKVILKRTVAVWPERIGPAIKHLIADLATARGSNLVLCPVSSEITVRALKPDLAIP
jgi:hypothetical protein